MRSILDYGSINWDPYLTSDIDKIERVQRRAARFKTGDYKTRDEGCVTKMLDHLELQPLQERRSASRLIFLYKVVEGLVPAIPPEEHFKPAKQLSPKGILKQDNSVDFNLQILLNVIL